MKVGISTACFYPYINTEDTLKIIKQTGFDICEVFLESDFEIDEGYCYDLRNRAEALGIKIYSIHAFNAGFEPYLFDRYQRRRNEMEEKFRAVCRAGNALGANCYTFHGIIKNMAIDSYERISEGMDRLCDIAEEFEIKIAWENVSWCKTCEPEFIKIMDKKIKRNIFYTLDIKQSIRSGHRPIDYLEAYGSKLINIHINDASDESTCLLPGEGNVDLEEIIMRAKAINSEIPLIIEVYNENFKNYEQLVRAREYLEKIVNN